MHVDARVRTHTRTRTHDDEHACMEELGVRERERARESESESARERTSLPILESLSNRKSHTYQVFPDPPPLWSISAQTQQQFLFAFFIQNIMIFFVLREKHLELP